MTTYTRTCASPDQGIGARTQATTCAAMIPPLGVSVPSRRYERMRRVHELNMRLERTEHMVEAMLCIIGFFTLAVWLS